AFLVSVLVRWPLAGVVWHGINGHGHAWRRDPRLLRAYTWASLLWTVVFAARVVLQGFLYYRNEETWLGVARLLMGYPLVGLALLGTVWAVRRAQRSPAPGLTGRGPAGR
ncbi:MAG: PROBABLE CONSERVED INTEGRAL MEMBRANE ALANINE AND LEUCINE RICH PROTEIN, partial [uncultured Pseudonocardia sp.]